MKKPAEQGPVGPGWKLAWLEAVARDVPDAAGSPLAVATVISKRVDSYGIVKNLTHPQIAKQLNLSVRTIATGYSILKARGHIEILKESRGRGAANEIKIARQDETGKNLLNPASMQDPAMQDSVEKHARSRQETYPNLHTLPSSYPSSYPRKPGQKNGGIIEAADRLLDKIRAFDDLPGAQICAGSSTDHSQGSFLARSWATVLAHLAQPNQLGEGKVRAWLADKALAVSSLRDGTLCLVARSAFIADRVRSEYAGHLLREWRRIDPAISQITVNVGALDEPAGHGPAPAEASKVVPLRERLKAKTTPSTGEP